MAGFIASQREEHGVPYAAGCRALGVSQAWFYKWRYGDASPRHARRATLQAEIARLFAQHRGTYGSPRITADLRDAGWRVGENTVTAIMAGLGLVARRRRRRKQTTRQGRGRWRAPDLIGRQFAAEALNRKWYGDGTEIPTDEGKLFLDSVLDMGSRRIVGFALGEHHDADLATAALQMSVAVRGGRDAITGVIFHTDQGSEGGFKWSSQHLDGRGVACRQQRWASGVVVGSRRRIGRAGQGCDPRGDRHRRDRWNGRSGVLSPRGSRARMPRSGWACRPWSVRGGSGTVAACHRSSWPSPRAGTYRSPSARRLLC